MAPTTRKKSKATYREDFDDEETAVAMSSSSTGRKRKRPASGGCGIAENDGDGDYNAKSTTARRIRPHKKEVTDTTLHEFDHDNCKLHRDTRSCRAVCNGIRYQDGERCMIKLKPGHYKDRWDQGFLPVCYLHRSQDIHRGNCKAVAGCGERCNRFCAWEPLTNMLCAKHVDAPMECYFDKLPTELRFHIFAHLIPAGPMPARYRELGPRGEYETVAALLRVNTECNSDIRTQLFHSKQHPVPVYMTTDYLGFMRRSYESNPKILLAMSYRDKHISTLYSKNYGFIRHLKVEIEAGRTMERCDDALYAILEASRSVLSALGFLGPNIARESESAENAESPKLESLLVQFRFREQPGRTSPDELRICCVFAVVKAVLSVWKIACTKLRWEIELYNDDQVWMRFENKSSKLKGRAELREVTAQQLQALRLWVPLRAAKSTRLEDTRNWNLYQEISMMAADLISLKILDSSVLSKYLMDCARKALESRDSETLEKTGLSLRQVWSDYMASQEEILRILQTQYLGDQAEGASHRRQPLQWTVPGTTEPLSWPQGCYGPVLGLSQEVSNFNTIYETGLVGKKKAYRLITPHLLRLQHTQRQVHELQ